MASKARPEIHAHLWYAKEAEQAARFHAFIFADSRVDGVTPLLIVSPSGPPGSALVEGGGKPQACGRRIDRFGLRGQIG